MCLIAMLAGGAHAQVVAPVAPATGAGDDAWMAALQDAMVEAKAGRRDLAIASLQRMRNASGDNRNRRGIAGLYLGQMLHFSARDREAQPVLVESVADLTAVRPACDEFIVKAQGYAWKVSLEVRAFDAALQQVEAQVRCAERLLPPTDAGLAIEVANHGYVQREAGRTTDALATAERASALLAARDPKRSDAARAAHVDGVRALALAANARWAEAKPLLERRMDALREAKRARTLEYALTLSDYANTLRGLGNAVDADATLTEALAILRPGGRRYAAWGEDIKARYAAVPSAGG
jgi:hypothetical protein